MTRPFVTLKLATSLDGKIALRNGLSQWITGDKAREMGRRLRGEHDAVAVGSNTAILDDPRLTTRINALPDPVRVIYDSRLRLLPSSNLAQTAGDIPVWMFTKKDTGHKARQLNEMGVKIIKISYHSGGDNKGLDISESLTELHNKGIGRLLVEGGSGLAASFIRSGLIDRIEWFRAPVIIGGDGLDSIGELRLLELSDMLRLKRIHTEQVGDDLHERYDRLD